MSTPWKPLPWNMMGRGIRGIGSTHTERMCTHGGADLDGHEAATQSQPLDDDVECLQAQLAPVSQDFVPYKTCERYLLEDCATTLHNCAVWLPMLVMESRKLALAIIKRGKNQGLTLEHTLALVVYTADLRQFGASDKHNLYHSINTALQNAEEAAARERILKQIRGYLHFFSHALALLPREHEGWTYRGITRAAFDSSETQYRQGAEVQWQGIVSTSKDKQVALNFSGKASGGAQGVMMRIWTCSGVSVENFSWFENRESEVILGPNCVFVVARGLYSASDPAGVEMIDLVQLQEEGARAGIQVHRHRSCGLQ